MKMTKATKQTVRRMFEKNAKLARRHLNAGQDLQCMCLEYNGIDLSDGVGDNDIIIDTIDYGYGACGFEYFHDHMTKHSQKELNR